MTSAARITANRENATHSTGPKTEESKSRTKLNALRHGMTGQVTVMRGEDREAFQKFCAEIVKDLAPQGAIETQLAQSIAEDNWRLNRGRAIESNILARGFAIATNLTGDGEIDAALTVAETFAANPKQFQLLSVYMQRTNRDMQKSLALLRQLQTERRAQHARDLEEAAVLYKASKNNGLPFNPAQNGFVCSTPEIEFFLNRRRLLLNSGKAENRPHYRPKAA